MADKKQPTDHLKANWPAKQHTMKAGFSSMLTKLTIDKQRPSSYSGDKDSEQSGSKLDEGY